MLLAQTNDCSTQVLAECEYELSHSKCTLWNVRFPRWVGSWKLFFAEYLKHTPTSDRVVSTQKSFFILNYRSFLLELIIFTKQRENTRVGTAPWQTTCQVRAEAELMLQHGKKTNFLLYFLFLFCFASVFLEQVMQTNRFKPNKYKLFKYKQVQSNKTELINFYCVYWEKGIWVESKPYTLPAMSAYSLWVSETMIRSLSSFPCMSRGLFSLLPSLAGKAGACVWLLSAPPFPHFISC